MIIGTSQIDITPKIGVELSGFAARIQPSVGILDRLYARAIYLEEGAKRLLWINCELIGFDRSIVEEFRRWASTNLKLASHQVMMSATHTHSGPCTIHLREAGEYDPEYVAFLQEKLRHLAKQTLGRKEPVSLVTVEGHLDLAVDRRKAATAHTDPRVAGLGFKRADGTFAAAVINYAIHPVSLGSGNRLISGDLSGYAADALAAHLKGNPVVLMTNGASGNLNPPGENVAPSKAAEWGSLIAGAVADLLAKAEPLKNPELSATSRIVQLPLDCLDAEHIKKAADVALNNSDPLSQWGDKYRRVVEHWRTTLLDLTNSGRNGSYREAELFAMRLGDVTLLGINAEVFSEFTDWLRTSDRKIYLIGYANGDMGYLPTRAAYAEGGYEVEVAHFFYGGFRPSAGGLELLASEAGKLLSTHNTVGL